MTSATSCNEEARAESENKILQRNVKELQAQLQKAFIRIRELVEEREMALLPKDCKP